MSRSVELLAAVADGSGSPEARRWGAALRDAGAATPEVADALARAPAVSAGPSLAWRIATFIGIIIAGAASARAVSVMNAAPGVDPIFPDWLPLAAAVPAVVVVVASVLGRRSQARTARVGAAARLGLELLRCRVPATLAVDVAAFVYALDEDARRRLDEVPQPATRSEARQRAAAALAIHAGKTRERSAALGVTLLAGVLVAALFAVFMLTYLGLLDGGLSSFTQGSTETAP